MFSLGTGLNVQNRGIYFHFLTKELFGYERESGENDRNSFFLFLLHLCGGFCLFVFALVALTGLIKSKLDRLGQWTMASTKTQQPYKSQQRESATESDDDKPLQVVAVGRTHHITD